MQLVAFPLGLLATAVVFDIIALVAHIPRFTSAAYLMIAAGVLTGLPAAVFGLIDLTAVPKDTRARRIGLLHARGNLLMVVLFAVSWLLRSGAEDITPATLPFVLELVAAATAFGAAWLGGELVSRLGVGVDEGANLQASANLATGIFLGHRTRRTG